MTELEQPAALLIFLATLGVSLLGLYRVPGLVDRFVMRPYKIARGRDVATVITSGFVHGDLGHLLFNLVTFYFFVFPMERVLGTTGFLILYGLGLVLSASCSVWKHRNDPGYATLGASGAISAVLFAFVVYFPDTTIIVFPIPVPIRAVFFAFAYVAWSWWASRATRDGINHDAHLCGALTGLAWVAVTNPGAYARLQGAWSF